MNIVTRNELVSIVNKIFNRINIYSKILGHSKKKWLIKLGKTSTFKIVSDQWLIFYFEGQTLQLWISS